MLSLGRMRHSTLSPPELKNPGLEVPPSVSARIASSLGQCHFCKENQMKRTLAALALCAFAQSAFAAEPDCSAIKRTSERLACYDTASPPKVKKTAAVESDASRAAYKDPFIVEDARTTAKLKNICRGC